MRTAHGRRTVGVGAALLGAVVALASAATAAQAAAPRSQVNGTTINDHGTKNVSGLSSVAMQMGAEFFSPSTLQGRPGQTIRIDLTNSTSVAHTFTLSSQNVDTTVAPGASASVTVKFPSSGSTVFICSFHTSMGMNGALQALAATPSPSATSATPTSGGSGGNTGSTMSGSTSSGSTSSGSTSSGGAVSGTSGQVAPVPAGGAATGAGGSMHSAGTTATVAGVVLGALLVALGVTLLRRRHG